MIDNLAAVAKWIRASSVPKPAFVAALSAPVTATAAPVIVDVTQAPKHPLQDDSDDELAMLMAKRSKNPVTSTQEPVPSVVESPPPREAPQRPPAPPRPPVQKPTLAAPPQKPHRDADAHLHQYIRLSERKMALLTQRYEVFESTSRSLDEKNRFIETEFTPQLASVDAQLAELRRALPQAEPVVAEVPPSEPVHSIDFSSQFSEPVVSLLSDDHQILSDGPEQVSEQANLEEARRFVEARRAAPAIVAELTDEEDNFGEVSMEGLVTPPNERDDDATDLSGFVVDASSQVDGDYTAAVSDVSSDDIQEIDADELSNLRLSQDTAHQLGLSYEDDYEVVEDFDTQLNDERELTNNIDVIEISDTSDYENDLPIFIKSEKAAPVAVVDDDSVFDSDDELDLIELGTSGDIIQEQIRAIPGSEPYIKEVYSVLNKVFKLTNFRANQLKAIVSILQGKDVFVLMPTGGGKSLCYQLPALVKVGDHNQGTTIVISPLISLMQDQVQHLRANNIKAGMVNSKNDAQEKKQTLELFRNGLLDLIYLSPEMINNSSYIQKIIGNLHENGLLNKVVVDEAHCISSWGHDFRPDYKGMNFFRTTYPDVPIMALTATANEKVRMDIVHHLKMKNPMLIKQSFNRVNLYYEIQWKGSNYLDTIKSFIQAKYPDSTGIIYCHSKQSCEQTSERLNSYGLKTAFYHAGMTTADRFQVQDDWQKGEVKVICATIAFGMGIDKPDVRFVIHCFLPRNLEGYYQETGRAGRDGLKSDCIMFYSYKDARSLQMMIQRDTELTAETRDNHIAKLRQVIQYCENVSDCRRKQVLQYFNETFDPEQCQRLCDNCNNNSNNDDIVEKDVTSSAKEIINLVSSIQDSKVTLLYCQDVFKGSNTSKITKNGHNQLPYHGKGKDLSRLDVERMFFHLLGEDVLMEYSVMRGGYASNYVKLGKNADLVLRGSKRIMIKFGHKASATAKATKIGGVGIGPATEVNRGFVSAKSINQPIRLPQNSFKEMNDTNAAHINYSYDELARVRLEKMMELNFKNSSVICTDQALKRIAVVLPSSRPEYKEVGNVSTEQASYFYFFKPTLDRLSKERKKLSLANYACEPETAKPRSTGRSSSFFRRGKRGGRASQGGKPRASQKKQKAMPL